MIPDEEICSRCHEHIDECTCPKKEGYCIDCNGEMPVRLEDCPAYKAKLRVLKEEK